MGRKRKKLYLSKTTSKKKSAKAGARETPLMKQYNAIKTKYPDAILLFRVGDFYETFGEDAIKVSKAVGIVLTARKNGAAGAVELAGFPHHSLENYLPKLVRAGYRVAICDQLEDPKKTKTIVKRGVTELVTPGVALNDNILDHKKNNFLASLHFDKGISGVAFVDISTGEFYLSEGSLEYIEKLMQSFQPSEVIFSKTEKSTYEESFGQQYYTYPIDEWIYTPDYAYEKLHDHFKVKNLKGFGIEGMEQGVIAAGSILHYLAQTEHSKLQHISNISRIQSDKYVWIDRFTIRNLELVSSQHETGKTLLEVLDHTTSPMGARLLQKWLLLPLKNVKTIQDRLDIVEHLLAEDYFCNELKHQIKNIGDIERLIAKVPVGRISPREVAQLKKALIALFPIKEALSKSSNPGLKKIGEQLNPCKSLKDRLDFELHESPPAALGKGPVIADGVSETLDELRSLAYSGKDYLLKIQEREIEKTGITSLKIGFNNVFGYYLEVTHRFKDKVPEEWIRKQTLVSAERYITEELKEYEAKILGAEEKIATLESELYAELVLAIEDYIRPIQLNGAMIAQLDCLINFAHLAEHNNYCKPVVHDGHELNIKNGRHPVIEKQLPLGEAYVPNDTFLDSNDQQVIIITGPNMSGKSALLRQTALITLMAQMGSYVPAEEASIGLVDKIFTRVGATDNISSGESTFMVEMNETASIMNNLSDRSLVILDEIGRGTSTYDGISIAWSLAEYLHNNGQHKPKALFATHYHELNELANQNKRIKNYHVATKEVNNKIVFLRKLTEGGSEHSFGIHVAEMAGMPDAIVRRAKSVLAELEKKSIRAEISKSLEQVALPETQQMNLFEINDPVLIELKTKLSETDLDRLTPLEAMMLLSELKKMLDY